MRSSLTPVTVKNLLQTRGGKNKLGPELETIRFQDLSGIKFQYGRLVLIERSSMVDFKSDESDSVSSNDVTQPIQSS